MGGDIIERLSVESKRQYAHHVADYVFTHDPDVFHDGTCIIDDAICEIAHLSARVEELERLLSIFEAAEMSR